MLYNRSQNNKNNHTSFEHSFQQAIYPKELKYKMET